MEICLHLIRTRLKEIQIKLKLLGIEIKDIQIELWPNFSTDFKIALWDGQEFIKGYSGEYSMSISEFTDWYKHKQILLRKF